MTARSGIRWERLALGALAFALVACGRTQPPAGALQIELDDLTEGQTLGAARDADAAASGFQLDVAIRLTDAKGAEVSIGSATLAWAQGDAAFSAPVSGTVDGARARFARLTLPAGPVVLRVEAVAADGTRKQTLDRALNVAFVEGSQGCAITITSPSSRPTQYVAADDQDPDVEGLQATLAGESPECVGRQVSLSRNGGAIEATTPVGADGSFSFSVTLLDGETARLTVAVADAAQVASNDFVDVTVDLSPPTFDAVAPNTPALTVVAATNVNLSQPGHLPDAVAGGDAQVQLDVTVSGAAGGSLVARYEGAEVSSPIAIAESPASVAVPVELPHGTSGVLTLEVRDEAGNVATRAFATVVDVVAPATPVVSANVTDARRATVELSWTGSGDDGGNGAVSGYDVRYATDAVLLDGIRTEAEFFGSEGDAPTSKRVGSGLLPAGTLAQTLTLPPFASYSFQVRAVDDVGNYSPLVATPMVENAGSYLVLANPGTGTRYGIRMAQGDFDGDGISDLAVGDDSSAQAVYFFRGGPTLETDGVWQTLTSPGGAAGNFGTSPAAGNLDGDLMADDFIVGSSTWSGNRGRAFLFPGQVGTGVVPSNRVEFRGEAGLSSLFGSHISVVPDLNGDGIDEIAVDASSGQIGQVYLFFGRSGSAWMAAATATDDAGATYYIPAEAADRVFVGPPLPAGSNATNALFGRNAVLVPVGDLDGDGVSELALAATRTSLNTVYVYDGALVLSRDGSSPALSKRLEVTEAQFTLQVEVQSGELNSGFGYQMLGGVDVVGDAKPDLLVSHPRASRIQLYAGQPDGTLVESGAIQAPDASTNFFGNAVASGDVNGDGWTDLVVGGNPSVGLTSGWIVYHSGEATAPYDGNLPGFNVSRHRGQTITRGLAVGVADLTGDGLPDVISSDPQDGAGNIYVRH